MYPAKGQETAQAIFDAITANPELHTQSVWAYQHDCGTRRCAAGWARHLHGHSYNDINHEGTTPWSEPGSMSITAHVAADLLQISESDARQLFYRTTNQEALTAIEWLARGKQLNWDEIITSRWAAPTNLVGEQ